MQNALVEQLGDLKDRLAHAEESIERAARNAFMEWGSQLKFIRESGLFVAYGNSGRCTWEDYVTDRWGMTPQRAGQLIDGFRIVKQIETIVSKGETIVSLPAIEAHVRPLAKLESPEQRAVVWQRAVETAHGIGITAKTVEAEVERFKAEISKSYWSLDEWDGLPGDEQSRLLTQYYPGKQFNKQEGDSIEWARWSWNPVTGCLHECAYCYARDIAERFYPHRFTPTVHPERMSNPGNTPLPDLSRHTSPVDQLGWRNVFVCSMADLFGKWVPSPWIDAVLQQAWDNPQWNFLFLTKFPVRMAEFSFPPNSWIGTTVDRQYAVERAEKAFGKIRASGYQGVAWLSCEPMLEELKFTDLGMFDWVVMGGGSKSSQTPETRPDWTWIVSLWMQAKESGLPVYMKTNLGIEQRVREYPEMKGQNNGK